MNATVISRQKGAIPYPNAATRQQVLHKILDTLLIGVSGMGIAVILLFLLVLV